MDTATHRHHSRILWHQIQGYPAGSFTEFIFNEVVPRVAVSNTYTQTSIYTIQFAFFVMGEKGLQPQNILFHQKKKNFDEIRRELRGMRRNIERKWDFVS